MINPQTKKKHNPHTKPKTENHPKKTKTRPPPEGKTMQALKERFIGSGLTKEARLRGMEKSSSF